MNILSLYSGGSTQQHLQNCRYVIDNNKLYKFDGSLLQRRGWNFHSNKTLRKLQWKENQSFCLISKNNFSSWTIERSFKLIAIYLGFHVTLEKCRNKLQRLFAKLALFLKEVKYFRAFQTLQFFRFWDGTIILIMFLSLMWQILPLVLPFTTL